MVVCLWCQVPGCQIPVLWAWWGVKCLITGQFVWVLNDVGSATEPCTVFTALLKASFEGCWQKKQLVGTVIVSCCMLPLPIHILSPIHRPGLRRCHASVGRGPFESIPSMCTLFESCLESVGNIAHELGHVIGFFHEHLRHDRDRYIQMNWSNVASEYIRARYERVDTHYTYVGTTYDPGSIMHYAPINFDTLNHSVPAFTLQKHVRYSGEIGQRSCLSKSDVEATNRMYICPRTGKYIGDTYTNSTLHLCGSATQEYIVKEVVFIQSANSWWYQKTTTFCAAYKTLGQRC